jgi:DNA adenine methylase
MLARRARAISNRLAAFPHTSDFYYTLRKQSPASLPLVERAARFIYLNRFCFNGVYRTNRDGNFNVPRGTKTGQLPSYEELRECAAALKKATLVAGDFEETLSKAKANDFVYLDPPYSLATDRHRGEYGYGGFSSDDLLRMERSLAGLNERGATFLLSYRCTSEVRILLRHWHQKTLKVRRHVAGFAVDRRNVRELLISNKPFVVSKEER